MSNKLILGAVALILVFWVGCGYNGLVKQNENVDQKWSDVESQYQRRSDLIPNIAKTVKSYADFEQETLTKVIEARAKATSVTINPGELTPENMAKFQEAQGELGSSLSRLLVSIERYPDLKANQGYQDLRAELAGTENRINVARKDFNAAVKDYNLKRKRFPTILISGILGFDDKPYFEADKGTEKAPDVGDNL